MSISEKIIENNKLIAEYMQIPKCGRCPDCGGFQYSPAIIFLPKEMQYSESWDWLMPVCKKIIDSYFDNREYIFEGLNKVDVDATYIAVVEFIKFWNDPKQKKRIWVGQPEWAKDFIIKQKNGQI